MKYETFKYLVVQKLHSHFNDSKKITIQEIKKNNGLKLDGLIILENEMNIAPTIYLNYYFKKYQDGSSFTDVFQEIITTYDENRPKESINISFFTDFEQAKKIIVYKIINTEKNEELLKDIPHIPILDLSIVFCCLLHSDDNGTASILIHNQHIQKWDVTPHQLLELAQENTPQLLSYDLQSMKSILSKQTAVNVSNLYPMYVLTNITKLNGAACILYKNLLQKIAEFFESDFYILPSSIHEVILLPANDCSSIEALSEMVREVNNIEVAEDEILSNHAYYYSKQEQIISM